MISIISGPTCVGKTYFIENKKDRILELSNLPPTTESYVTGSFSSNHSEFPDVVSHWIKRNDGGAIFDQIVCIHHNRLTGPQSSQIINAYKDNYWYFSKTVIILGVPYSEYKVDPAKWGILCCTLPDSLVFRNLSDLPFGSINPEMPLLADLAIKTPSSTDRKIAFE